MPPRLPHLDNIKYLVMSIDRTNLSSFEVGSIVCMEGCSTPGLRSTHIV